MAIFDKRGGQANNLSDITTLSAGVSCNGKIEAECAVHIDGKFVGDIVSKGDVSIGDSGHVQGDIFAQQLFVAGRFEGTAECEFIELMDASNVDGKLTSENLAVNAGAVFNGTSTRRSNGSGSSSKSAKKSRQARREALLPASQTTETGGGDEHALPKNT